ncbi:Membrane associated serine protease, rhomboid family [Cognatiyoonia sediminum]|uniref:Membrane associated serine protease, rhomboid family n=1 Tax=Cognatiyoonia sediminum TaxID=1508389 RepID=A0A1M5Q1M8_9RHOB|nr:rhomboid family intramembrane serine protease [Cognatiyoonia sediminum]SHH07842.1 Membrane associated serine protease, rhomboid family [Cognatiyoonia sediminum]
MSEDNQKIATLLDGTRPAIWTIVALCVAIEAVLTLSDWGVLFSTSLRFRVYEYAGFWSGLLGDWTPNYPLQPYTMFLTYGFLHAGLGHLIVNMITLVTAGNLVVERVGTKGFLILYSVAIVGGGIGYGLLAPTLAPMVGASGALFGLVGGLLAWSYIDRFNLNEALWPVARAALFLVGLNLVLWWAMDGQLAWQTHLGGFIAGWIGALLIDPRPIEE